MTVMNGTGERRDCIAIAKLENAHERHIVRMFFLANYKNYALVTVAHDSLKIWNIVEDSENGTRFEKISEASKWRCGVQSVDMKPTVPEVIVVGLDSILYRVSPQIGYGVEKLQVDPFDFGYMETWDCLLDSSNQTCITKSFSGHLVEIDLSRPSRAEIARKGLFRNVRNITCMSYGNISRIIAIAQADGCVVIFDHDTFKEKFIIETHYTKINVVRFTNDDKYLLTGCEDRTIRLNEIPENPSDKNANLIRQYCGHKSPVLDVAFDPTSNGERFASCSSGCEVFIWGINQPRAKHIVATPHEGIITSVLFSYNGYHLFTAGEDKKLVCYKIPVVGDPILTLMETTYLEANHDSDEGSQKDDLYGNYGEEDAEEQLLSITASPLNDDGMASPTPNNAPENNGNGQQSDSDDLQDI